MKRDYAAIAVRNQTILEQYRQGVPRKQLAHQYGVTQERIRQILLETAAANLRTEIKDMVARDSSPAEIIALYEHNYRDIIRCDQQFPLTMYRYERQLQKKGG